MCVIWPSVGAYFGMLPFSSIAFQRKKKGGLNRPFTQNFRVSSATLERPGIDLIELTVYSNYLMAAGGRYVDVDLSFGRTIQQSSFPNNQGQEPNYNN